MNVDYAIRDEGTVVLLWPISQACEKWIEEHVHYQLTWGHAIVVEPRYASDILAGMDEEGFVGRRA